MHPSVLPPGNFNPLSLGALANLGMIAGLSVADGTTVVSPANGILGSYPIPFSSMIANPNGPSRGFRFSFWGQSANNVNAKSVNASVQFSNGAFSTQILSGPLTASIAGIWYATGMVLIIQPGFAGLSTCGITGGGMFWQGTFNGSTSTVVPQNFTNSRSVNINPTQDAVIALTCSQVAAGDVTLNGAMIELF